MATVTETEDPDVFKAHSIAACEAQSRRAVQVCDLLEALADDLPRKQAPVWRETQHQCRGVLQPHFSFLAYDVLPMLLKRSKKSADREGMLARLITDIEMQLHALQDLDDFMSEALLSERFDQNAESLGFALRSFFDTIRHNLRWEQDVIWPLSMRILTVEDLKKLVTGTASELTLH